MSDLASHVIKNGLTFTSHHAFSPRPESVLGEYISTIAKMAKENAKEYQLSESSLFLPLDTVVLKNAKEMANRYGSAQLKYVIVIGVGGSNLGTKAIYDALYGSYDFAGPRMPKLLFLDTVSHDALLKMNELLERKVADPNEILINLISKSGTTTESIANFELLYQTLAKRFTDIHSRVVCTTDSDSALWAEGHRRDFGLLPIPALVGGRFSVFSSVGIFPLLLAGVDVEKFQEGASNMLHQVLADDEANPARNSAEELFGAMKAGYGVLNIFHFNPELESLGKWERQLIAESLGKEKNRAGEVIHAGITPIVSIGSTDLHSMAQLYLGGPRDKFTMLIRAEEISEERLPVKGVFASLVKGIGGKTATEIMEAIFTGVTKAYKDHQLPFSVVRMEAVSPYALGAYMELRMATVMYLAKLMNVNPFDQPNVEDYKKVTREILNQ